MRSMARSAPAFGVALAILLTVSVQAYPNKPSGIKYVQPAPELAPGTPVEKDSIRVTYLGTGTPDEKHSQFSSGILVELGNGDSFVFDLGGGAFVTLNSLGLPLSKINYLFLSHLHSDHITDIPPFLVLRGLGANIPPLQVYGPSSARPRFGTAAVIDGLRQFLAWDQLARATVGPNNRQAKYDAKYNANVEVHEFDFAKKGQVVFNKNGVKVTSTPVHHYFVDGPVAFRLEWNGLSFVYSGDRNQTQWAGGPDNFIELAKGADVVTHEVVGPIDDSSFSTLIPAWQNILVSHTSPRDAGAIFQKLQPRVAIIHHALVSDHSYPQLISELRLTYPKGALAVAADGNVFILKKSGVTQTKWIQAQSAWGYAFSRQP